MVEFGGWSMPVQYTSIVAEHQATRQAAGLFDISHMGRIRFEIVPGYLLPFTVHGLYDLSQHKPMDPGGTQD